MKALVAVARREIVEKPFLLLLPLVFSVFPFLLPLARHITGGSAREVRDWVAVFAALSIGAAFAVALGSTVLVGDLAARKAGFFFSRPISAAALWAGKLGAAYALVLAGFLLTIAPAWIAGRGLIPVRDLGWGTVATLAAAAGALLLLVLVSHAVATIMRSRSSAALLDLAAGMGAAFAGGWAASRLFRAGYQPYAAIVGASAAAVFAALLLAGYRAVERGRTDIRAAHRALSVALWAVLGAATIGLVAYAAWVVAAPATALSRVEYAPTVNGEWLFLRGRARGADAGFLYQPKSGRSQRIGTAGWTVAPGGRFAAWVQRDPDAPLWSVHMDLLSDTEVQARPVRITFRRPISSLALSSDGARVAALEGGLLTVSETETGRSLASVRALEAGDWGTVSFRSPDLVRIIRTRHPQSPLSPTRVHIDVLELDVPSRRLAVTGSSDEPRGAFPILESAGGDRLILRDKSGTHVTLRDARTLAVLASLREGEPLASSSASFLSDGRIVLGLSDGKTSWLELFSADGARKRRIALAGGGSVRPGAEPASGQFFVLATPPRRKTAPVLELVDLERGTARVVGGDLAPVRSWWEPTVPAGSDASKLFLDSAGRLVRLDPATGERRVLLGRS